MKPLISLSDRVSPRSISPFLSRPTHRQLRLAPQTSGRWCVGENVAARHCVNERPGNLGFHAAAPGNQKVYRGHDAWGTQGYNLQNGVTPGNIDIEHKSATSDKSGGSCGGLPKMWDL
jgi:hypothetical protein